MNSSDLREWSRQRWCRVIGSILALQLLAVAVLSSRQLPTPRPVVSATQWRLPSESNASDSRDLPFSDDPWLFATANPAGFSGSAWLRPASTDYQVPAWEDSLDFLDFNETIPSNPLAQFSVLGTLPRDLNLELAPQFLENTVITNQPAFRASTWSFSGDIATNTLLSSIAIPHQIGLDIVNSTVVQIAVLPSGFTHVARVWRSCGSHSIDLQAVSIAQTLRFIPSTVPTKGHVTSNLTWGWFEVQWHTEALTASNATKSSNP